MNSRKAAVTSISLLAVLSALALAACSGSQAVTSSQSTEYAAVPKTAGGSAPVSLGPSANGSTYSSSTDVNVPAPGPKIIQTGHIDLGVPNGKFDTVLTQIQTLVVTEQGFLSGTDAAAVDGDSQIRTGSISFEVPASKFLDTIGSISKLGSVRSEKIGGQDVSAQYVDLQARLANAEAQRDAYLTLLSKATTTADIIAIQQQLGQVTGDIEVLKGQIGALDHGTQYSTLTVAIRELGATAPVSDDPWGFKTALSSAAHNSLGTINAAIQVLGYALPYAILGLIGYAVWRRTRHLLPARA